MRLVRTLTRSIVFAPRSATHREPKARARPIGDVSPSTFATCLFVRGSSRVMKPEQRAPAAQTARRSATRNEHCPPETRILAVIAFVSGSMRTTELGWDLTP